jgi:hypothetical protein
MRPPVFSCLVSAGCDPFTQKVSLEFRKNSQQTGQGPTGRGGQIEGFRQRDNADTQFREFVQGANQIGQRPSPAI